MTKPVGETPPLENSLQKQSLAFGRGLGLPSGSDGKESAYNAGDLGWEDPLEKEMSTHFSILACTIP